MVDLQYCPHAVPVSLVCHHCIQDWKRTPNPDEPEHRARPTARPPSAKELADSMREHAHRQIAMGSRVSDQGYELLKAADAVERLGR